MTLILKELCDLFLGQPDFMPRDSEYWEFSERIDEKESGFTEEQIQKIESMFDDMNASNWIEVENAFTQGFCAGAQLMIEILAKK